MSVPRPADAAYGGERRQSRELAAQCLLAGLVGELVVHIIPVLLRHGTPLFPDATRCLSKVVESYQAG